MNLKMIVPSQTRPGTHYTITRHADTRSWSCSCPAWRHQHAHPTKRSCKHIKSVALDMSLHVAKVEREHRVSVFN
jgi:hypothetical protein